MKRLLFLTLSTLCAATFAQVPDYVPTDGLVAWFPFNGDANDVWMNNHDATVDGAVLAEDRFGLPESAYFFDGNDRIFPSNPTEWPTAERTTSIWMKSIVNVSGGRTLFGYGGASCNSSWLVTYNNQGNTPSTTNSFEVQAHCNVNSTAAPMDPSEFTNWHHVLIKTGADGTSIYVDGVLSGSSEIFISNTTPGCAIIGATPSQDGGCVWSDGNNALWHGMLDDFGIWSRALSDEEIMGLFLAEAPSSGCADASACNYNSEADVDDGSCVFAPVIDLGEDIETCEDSVVLDAGEGFNFYEWSTGETTQTIVVTETGEYAVNASNVIENNHALQFNGSDATGAPAEPILFGTESFSVSVDCKLDAFKGNDSEPYSYIIGHPLTQGTGDHGFKIQTAGTSLNGGFQVHINDEGTTHFNVISFDNGMETNVELDQWYDLTMVVDRDNAQFSFYVDGVLIETQTIHPDFGNVDHPNGMSLGVQSIHGSSLLNGDLDNLQIWDVALSAEEVAQWQTTVPSGSETGLVGYWNFEEGEGDEAYDVSHLAPTLALNNVGWTDETPSNVFDASCAASDSIQVSWLIRGCTDPEACNYVEDASCDDGTCASCEALQTACGPGTIWDAEMQMCIGDGSGDINLDGCVQLNDLLDLLSAYGNCASEESAWQCGEKLEYQGYDYATVLIGEQCWFAENARYLPEVSFVETGSETDGSPHAYVYGYSGNALEEAMATESYENFGGLYNFEAVQEWALCPAGWHVPTDDEFKTMESNVGLPQQELEGTAWRGEGLAVGNTLRSDDLWNAGAGVESGTVGFEGRPSGYRISWLGDEYFEAAGQYGAWWTSSMSGGKGWQRGIANYNLGIYRTLEFKQVGFAVRCIKNAE